MGRFFLLSALLTTLPVAAEQAFDSQQLVKKDTLHASISLGYGGIENPVRSSDNITTPLLPSIAYYGDNWFFDDFSFGYSLLETQDYYLDISTRFNDDGFFFELDGIDKLFAVGPISESPTAPHYTPISLQPIKRDLSYLGGLAFGFQGVADIWFELATLQDITDVHNGHEIQFNAYRAMPLYQGMLALEAGINYKNDELIEYYYRVRKGEAISRLPQYDLQSSVNYHLKVNYEYPLSDDWSVDVKVKHTWLDSRLADSPMIDQSGYFSGFAGIKYTF